MTPPMRVSTLVAVVLLDWAALGLTIGLLPGISASSGWAVLLAAIVLGALGAALRPVAAVLVTRIGWAGVFLGWLLSQAVLVYLALLVTPGLHVTGFWPAFWASWVYGALVSGGLWVVTAGQPGMVTRHLLRINRRHRRAATTSDVPGVVMIQIDGLSAPLARMALSTGALPTLNRWLRTGSHTLAEWHAELPATTPASQAGLLHGASAQVPAFRWYEKESGRLVVTNHPRDSALVESRLTDGRGLLVDGGVSVSNVFSGDAPTSLLTMSTVGTPRAPGRPARFLGAYLIDPFGFTRSLFLTVGEIVKELYQARRQRLRRVEPRIPRTASYVLLRGLTNVLLRHLNLSLIAEHMMRGAPSVYCDFVDYDEIAHHAGPARPEALASLEGIDSVLATLEELASAAPRPYHLVVLSDHGQSQGATFLQRYGVALEDLVRQLSAAPGHGVVVAPEDEQAGRARTLRAGLLPKLDGPDPAGVAVDDGRPELVVAASGNLAMVYLARHPGRVTLEEIEEWHPALLAGLTGHPGIGWVMVRSRELGPVVLGHAGRRVLADDRVEGDDPLAGCGPLAAADLRRHDALPHVGDLLINSVVDPRTQEVAAFEELIGCHGGLGGWQNRPVLIHPAAWPVEQELVGADAVHRQLVRWLELLGQRAPDQPGSAAGSGPAAGAGRSAAA
ncbi:type I phosphodiesterase/nucleotide pyrophosphatase [Krasilnikovia cinnamomea]|uniref:Type I phosphodiesterase/nucleotide pyrophosphatase n=1 Tax=Krasilnikovia cinnamomea TaxID=349313 RepID=A0A4Q7ZGC5_9ACTN|nr:phage holin family protein [Krasilnikovia cinnamomea]RZU49434.1 type I phosphodiesterase/nucleotide pyrophosphatase [Krasilnikovia cinnamomea]